MFEYHSESAKASMLENKAQNSRISSPIVPAAESRRFGKRARFKVQAFIEFRAVWCAKRKAFSTHKPSKFLIRTSLIPCEVKGFIQ